MTRITENNIEAFAIELLGKPFFENLIFTTIKAMFLR